jgi:predicted methyltransferase
MSDTQYLLSSDDARNLLQLGEQARIELSLDLNLSLTEVTVSPEGLLLPSGLLITRSELQEIARKRPRRGSTRKRLRRRVFSLKPGGPEPVELVGEHYYKLTPTTGAPTIEIDGIQMHRTSAVDPFEDSRQKVEGIVRGGDAVLDTCGGLGYTAIWSVRLGAASVISVEVCPEVRQLRLVNPWSRELFGKGVELVDADVFTYIQTLPAESVNSLIHDPPRFSLAGELYGSEFYAQLFRVLKPGGLLFHYTGAPYSRRGLRDFPSEVVRRLARAGFRARREPQRLGVSARKLT